MLTRIAGIGGSGSDNTTGVTCRWPPVARLGRVVVLLFFTVVVATSGQTGRDAVSELTAVRAAVEDELYDVAEKRARALLSEPAEGEAGLRGPEEVERAAGLLMRALHAQGKHEAILELLTAKNGWSSRVMDKGLLVYWRAVALYERGALDQALELVAGFDEEKATSRFAADMQRLQAWCRLKRGETDAAFALFAAFDREHGASEMGPENLLDWAKALLAAGQTEAANPILLRLAALPPAQVSGQQGRVWLGHGLMATGQRPEAVAMFASVGTNTNACQDLRAEAWLFVASAQKALTNMPAVVAALSNGLALAESPELKRKGGMALGRALLEMGQLDSGIPMVKAYVSASPQAVESEACQLALAQALLDHDRSDEAVMEFQHYLETFTNTAGQARACFGKGWALFNVGRYAESAAAFVKAHDLYGSAAKKGECLLKVGDAHFANGQFRLAAGTYRRLLHEYPDLDLAPNAMFQLAESLGRAEDSAAEVTFLGLAARYPETVFAEEALLRVAELKQKDERWIEAIEAFGRVVTVYSNGVFVAEARAGRGLALYNLFRFQEALRDFECVVADFPESAVAERANYMRGMCLYGMWRDKDAMQLCKDFLVRYPESPWAPAVRFWIAKQAFNGGEYEEAEMRFLEFAEKYPANAEADHALLRAGLAASARHEYVRVVEHVARLVKDHPESGRLPEARMMQGEALCEQGRFSAAILVFDEMINKYPDRDLTIRAWLRKGDCHFTLGTDDATRYKESRECYRVVANSSSADADTALEAEYKIGRCLEKLGRAGDALEQYYIKVIVRFLDEREKGAWRDEVAKMWFVRAVFNASDIMAAKKQWRRAVLLLERVIKIGVPGADEAEKRIKQIKAEHRWLF